MENPVFMCPEDSQVMSEDKNKNNPSFAEMMAEDSGGFTRLEPGEKVRVKVVKIGREWVFVDTGRKGEGVVDVREILDGEGKPRVQEGEMIEAFFLDSNAGEQRFTVRLGRGGGGPGNTQYEDAYHAQIPVEGLVQKEIKGGYEVMLGGTVRAFCPFSQISLRRSDPSVWVGTRTSFLISQYEEKGRNIVVSRRKIEEEQQAADRAAMAERLQVGMIVSGTVSSVLDFGAFVDVGGVDGLVPRSEISYDHQVDISTLVAPGQSVSVRILQLDFNKNKHLFSIKQVGPSPWDTVADRFPAGSHIEGRVSRLAPFGAFVTLADGIDGLMHITAMKLGKRIGHPKEVLNEGDVIPVVIEGVDLEAKRISLSWDRELPEAPERPDRPDRPGRVPREPDAPSWNEVKSKYQEEKPAGMGLFGQLLSKQLDDKKKK